MPVYGRKASEHINAMPLWRAYKLQIYFTAKGLIDYFLASRNLDKEAEIMQDVEASQANWVPWLVYTGFPMHLQGLRDTEIISSYALPRSVDDDDNAGGDSDDNNNREGEEEGGAGNTDIDLRRILAAAESILRDAYKLCSDKSPNYKIMQQHAKRLSNFCSNNSHISTETHCVSCFRPIIV
ncbi:hypothetical protein QL093DRAFT_2561487 [Fusarium oxysporum]|nr:hypothetical protein QL093DRAFT_2570525 [Fusarium oxysporum]KAJ9424360.1 hypothetical protein QL093DRAFT_2561487 [Fusarium oxysporum]